MVHRPTALRLGGRRLLDFNWLRGIPFSMDPAGRLGDLTFRSDYLASCRDF
jgi:hypothetical protein